MLESFGTKKSKEIHRLNVVNSLPAVRQSISIAKKLEDDAYEQMRKKTNRCIVTEK